MEVDQDPTQFAPECVDEGTKSLVMIWGDSGAASLYPGLRTLADHSGTFRLAQFTSSSCPPILSYESVACKASNTVALERLRVARPDVVLLSAIWQFYDSEKIGSTIAELKRFGVPRIVLIGPGLSWKEPPSHIVFKRWLNDPLHQVAGARLDYNQFGQYEGQGVDMNPARRGTVVESTLRKVAQEGGAEYVSVLGVLCDGNWCLMRAPDGKGTSFFLDTAHLNPNGSDFVIAAIADQLKLGSLPSTPR